MRAAALVLCGTILSTAAQADQVIFYTVRLPDARSIDLTILQDQASTLRDYDFEVGIGVAETDARSGLTYTDPLTHRASVRCGFPAAVAVGGRRYVLSVERATSDDWKFSLWKALCSMPTS